MKKTAVILGIVVFLTALYSKTVPGVPFLKRPYIRHRLTKVCSSDDYWIKNARFLSGFKNIPKACIIFRRSAKAAFLWGAKFYTCFGGFLLFWIKFCHSIYIYVKICAHTSGRGGLRLYFSLSKRELWLTRQPVVNAAARSTAAAMLTLQFSARLAACEDLKISRNPPAQGFFVYKSHKKWQKHKISIVKLFLEDDFSEK